MKSLIYHSCSHNERTTSSTAQNEAISGIGTAEYTDMHSKPSERTQWGHIFYFPQLAKRWAISGGETEPPWMPCIYARPASPNDWGRAAFQSCANVKTDRRQKGKPCSLCGDASEATRILDRSNVLRRNGFPDGQGWKTLLGDMQCAFRRLLDQMPSKDWAPTYRMGGS